MTRAQTASTSRWGRTEMRRMACLPWLPHPAGWRTAQPTISLEPCDVEPNTATQGASSGSSTPVAGSHGGPGSPATGAGSRQSSNAIRHSLLRMAAKVSPRAGRRPNASVTASARAARAVKPGRLEVSPPSSHRWSPIWRRTTYPGRLALPSRVVRVASQAALSSPTRHGYRVFRAGFFPPCPRSAVFPNISSGFSFRIFSPGIARGYSPVRQPMQRSSRGCFRALIRPRIER